MSDSVQPLVTVGIPTYNRPEGLAQTLERITNQTYRNLEIIVSDNCSPNESDVMRVINPYLARDSRIRFTRQKTNLGSLGNFYFLIQNATGDYFCWAADDDEVDTTYIETLLNTMQANPKAAVAMTGYTVRDVMSEPPIILNLTKHLYGLQGQTPYQRILSYIKQPDHLGKSRIVWGLFRRKDMLQAFEACVKSSEHVGARMWCDIPIEVRILAVGDLAIDPKNLFHVSLLPTSDGKKGLSHKLPKLLEIARRGYESYSRAVMDASLSNAERKSLLRALRLKYIKDQIQLSVYYGLIAKFPKVARWVKKLWYLMS